MNRITQYKICLAALIPGLFILPELGTLEWDILNPDRLINLEIDNKRRRRII